MRCWNCNKMLPKGAKVCARCEAQVEASPTKEEVEAAKHVIEILDDEARAELIAAIDESSTAEEFADRLLIGDCPKCGSSDVGNCENDAAIQDIVVGRCYACGQLWCTLCDRLFEKGETSCDCDPFDSDAH